VDQAENPWSAVDAGRAATPCTVRPRAMILQAMSVCVAPLVRLCFGHLILALLVVLFGNGVAPWALGQEAPSSQVLDKIRLEVAELREAPPPFLQFVTGPTPLRVVAIAGVLVESRESAPWWAVDVALRAPPGSPYAGGSQEHIVRVVVGIDWPKDPPVSVRFVTAIEHLYIDPEDSGEVRVPAGQLFATTAAASPGGPRRHSIRGGITRLHFALGGPLNSLAPDMQEAWLSLAQAYSERVAAAVAYTPWQAHSLLFRWAAWDDKWLKPQLRAALCTDRTRHTGDSLHAGLPAIDSRGSALRGLANEVLPGVFEVPVFSPGFSALLRTEIENFLSMIPTLGVVPRRPNNHHRYGAVAGDIGLEPLMQSILQRVLAPLARVLFPFVGAELDEQHSFFVRYRHDQDTYLDNHHDDSDVTLNVALDVDEREAAEIIFCGLVGAPDHRQYRATYRFRPGFALMHLGRSRHGVPHIGSGERQNLIMWGRSSAWRRTGQGSYEREQGPPDSRCLSYTHDRDYTNYRMYPPGGRDAAINPWCPPSGFAHDDPQTATAAVAP